MSVVGGWECTACGVVRNGTDEFMRLGCDCPDQPTGRVIPLPISETAKQAMIAANAAGKEAAANAQQANMRELRDGLEEVAQLLESVRYYEAEITGAVDLARVTVQTLLEILAEVE